MIWAFSVENVAIVESLTVDCQVEARFSWSFGHHSNLAKVSGERFGSQSFLLEVAG
jgi:hypothetical protein